MVKPTALCLAQEFSRALKGQLSVEELRLIVSRNRAEANSKICHSHDFCDANVVLHEVFLNHGMDIADEGGRDKWGALWDEAWNIAKTSEFWTA